MWHIMLTWHVYYLTSLEVEFHGRGQAGNFETSLCVKTWFLFSNQVFLCVKLIASPHTHLKMDPSESCPPEFYSWLPWWAVSCYFQKHQLLLTFHKGLLLITYAEPKWSLIVLTLSLWTPRVIFPRITDGRLHRHWCVYNWPSPSSICF